MASARCLKIVSLVTLTVQNSLLTILLHYSRVNAGPSKMYSSASAVLLNEILKLVVSFLVSGYNALYSSPQVSLPVDDNLNEKRRGSAFDKWALTQGNWKRVLGKMRRDVFSADCWKLALPACLYTLQNNLQYVAATNLDVPTFQVTYNLKILTTAVFSVIMLKRRLSVKKWVALVLLAAGVGIVQLQSTDASGGTKSHGGAEMNRVKGLAAIASACLTSGLAGVYFEMVLKGSKADLWIRNIQLSLFSLIPAVLPIIVPRLSYAFSSSLHQLPPRQAVFAHFGVWAWAVVLCQVVGGLVTALVIKYADNLLKGFAGSLAVILSFLAGMLLFDFHATTSFVIGALIVVSATVLYSQSDVRSSTYAGSSTPADYSPILKGYSYSKSPDRRSSGIPSSSGTPSIGPLDLAALARESAWGSIPTEGPHRRNPNSGSQTPEIGATFDRLDEYAINVAPAIERTDATAGNPGL